MQELNLPEDLESEVEVIELDDDIEIEEYQDDTDMVEDQEPVEDLAKLTFSKHQRAVYCCALSKDNKFAVTGSRDDMAYVWDVETGNVVFECTGHKDSVTEVGFNYDGELLVTADMGGLTQVWNFRDKKLIWCNEGDDMSWLFWHPSANVILSGTNSGAVYVWQVPEGNCKVLPSYGEPACEGKLLHDGKRLVVGYGDGILKLWDIKSTSIIWQTPSTGVEIIKMGVSDDDSIVVVGPTGDAFKVADGKFLYTFDADDGDADIDAILFNAQHNLLITGYDSGLICVWDLGRRVLRHKADVKSYITTMVWGKDNKLLCGTLNAELYVCDVLNCTLIEKLTGHISEILSICVASDNSFAVTTSNDNTAKVYNLKKN